MRSENELLEELAGAILDGTQVDWTQLESRVTDPDPSLIAQLKTLAALNAVGAGYESPENQDYEYWGHLRLLERIGRGSTGDVYRARDTRLDRDVALKLLPVDSSPGLRPSSIIEEGRLLARIRHPNVVTIYGAERIGGRIGLWMELVKGRTLEEAVAERNQFTVKEVIEVGLEVCKAVSAVHSAALIHRDIKAANVMITDDRRVVLMDFGTGLQKTDGSERVAGTPLYLAPELFSGEMATVQSDVYSIGVLLYRLLTQSYPVRANDLADLRRAHATGKRTPIRAARSDVPAKLARVIERATNQDPAHRYQSADTMAADLAGLNAPARANRLVFVAVAALAVVAAVWIASALRSRESFGTPSGVTATAAVVPPWSETPIIVVLPFKNLSSAPDADYFVDGMTTEVIRNLAAIDGLQVKSPTSSFAFKNRRNLADVRQQLGVNLALEATVQRDGRRLNINAALVDVERDVSIWSDKFDRVLEDVFAIQDEISQAIVSKLRLTLRRTQSSQRTSVEAYDTYLRARALSNQGPDVGTAQQAVRLYEQVIAADPSFAPAYAGLADAYAWMSAPFNGLEFKKALARMRPAALKALELDPLSAEAHAAMGVTYSRERDWANAEKSFRQAIELNPSITHIYNSFSYSTLIPLGKSAEAVQLLRAATQRDPLSQPIRSALAFALIVNGRYDEVIAMYAPNVSDPLQHKTTLVRALTFAGRIEEALPICDSMKGEVGSEHWTAAAYAKAGRLAEVEAMIPRQKQPFQLAFIYAALKDKDRTFDELNQSVEAWGHRVGLFLVSPEMALLRGDDRLDALRKRLNLPVELQPGPRNP